MRDELVTADQIAFWQCVTIFIRKSDDQHIEQYSPVHEMVGEFSELFLRIADDSAWGLFNQMIDDGEVEITAYLIRRHIWHFGLFGQRRGHVQGTFLTSGAAERIAIEQANHYCDRHLHGQFIWNLWSLDTVYIMLDTGVWNDACEARLTDDLNAEPKRMDALTLMFFGGYYTSGGETIDKLAGLENFRELIRQRASALNIGPSLKAALRKARDAFIGV